MNAAELVIAKFGGPAALARLVGKGQTTISYWKKTGSIPAKWHPTLLSLAQQHNIALDARDLAAFEASAGISNPADTAIGVQKTATAVQKPATAKLQTPIRSVLLGLFLMLLSGGAVAAFFLWHGPAALFAGNEDAPAAESAMDGTAAPPLQPGVQQTAAQNAKWFTYSMHGAWKVRCHGQVGPDSCIGLIDLTDSHKRRLVVWAIGRNTKGSFVSNIQVPSGVQLDQGLSIRFAGKNEPPDARRLAFSNCEPAGCVTKVLMDNDFLGQARMASRADLTAVSSEGKAITFHVPVAGLDEVLNDL